MTALESVFAALTTAGTVTAVLGDRIYPKQAAEDAAFPYALLDTERADPENALAGFAGLDICEVSVEVWANSYTEATADALLCRRALEAAGFICLGQTIPVIDNNVSPPEFCEGWRFQAYQ